MVDLSAVTHMKRSFSQASRACFTPLPSFFIGLGENSGFVSLAGLALGNGARGTGVWMGRGVRDGCVHLHISTHIPQGVAGAVCDRDKPQTVHIGFQLCVCSALQDGRSGEIAQCCLCLDVPLSDNLFWTCLLKPFGSYVFLP